MEVGGMKLEILGYHYRHHTHGDKPHNWTVDLCPKCAGELKDDLNAVIKEYKNAN